MYTNIDVHFKENPKEFLNYIQFRFKFLIMINDTPEFQSNFNILKMHTMGLLKPTKYILDKCHFNRALRKFLCMYINVFAQYSQPLFLWTFLLNASRVFWSDVFLWILISMTSWELLPFDEFLFATVNPVYIIVGNPQVILIERKLADSNSWVYMYI